MSCRLSLLVLRLFSFVSFSSFCISLPVAPVVQLVTSNILTLGREFESRRMHTNWEFLSHQAGLYTLATGRFKHDFKTQRTYISVTSRKKKRENRRSRGRKEERK